MRGWWKPFAVPLGIGVAASAFLALRAPVRDPTILLVLPLFTLPFGALFYAQPVSMANRFLHGLEEGGERTEIVEDEMTWLGERRLVARGALGAWRVRASGGKSASLWVRAPTFAREQIVLGNARRAGRRAAEALQQGARWEVNPPGFAARIFGHVQPAWRPRLALVILAGSFAAALALALLAGRSGAFAFAVGMGAGLGWFVATVMVASYASLRGPEGALAAGASAGVAYVAAAYAAGLQILGVDPTIMVAVALAGALALAVAWALPHSRLAATGAVALAAGAGLLLPRFFAAMGVALGIFALVVAWRPRP